MSIIFFGFSNEELDLVKNNIQEIKNEKQKVEILLPEIKNTECLDSATSIIGKLNDELEKNNQFITEKGERFSLLGWLIKLF